MWEEAEQQLLYIFLGHLSDLGNLSMISPVKIWRGQRKIKNILGSTGSIISFTKIFVPPVGFESQAPYVVAVVRLASGINYTAQIVDWEESHLKTGQKVLAVLRRTRNPGEEGVIPYGIKFKPIN